MTQPNWQSLASGIVVPANPAGALWTRAVDYVAPPRKLKIVARANSTWTLLPGCTLGPDGDRLQTPSPTSPPLLPSALLGALIGKIGGSAADNTAPIVLQGIATPAFPIPPFSVGSFWIVELASTTPKGPLFLTMNDAAAAFEAHDHSITVDIFEAL